MDQNTEIHLKNNLFEDQVMTAAVEELEPFTGEMFDWSVYVYKLHTNLFESDVLTPLVAGHSQLWKVNNSVFVSETVLVIFCKVTELLVLSNTHGCYMYLYHTSFSREYFPTVT